MRKNSSLQLKSFTREGIQNIALLVLAVFYLVQFGVDLAWKNMCGQLAIDYCAFWSAAEVANEKGYASIYDLNSLEEIQRKIFPQRYEVEGTFATVPTPYLPVFILPFQALSFFGPFAGYWVWTILNTIIFFFYLRFFTKNMTREQLAWRIFFMLLLSLPVFLNFYYGQVNIWLTICVGEYMRALANGKPFRAGLWLGGLLIKPQYLILIGMALLIQKATKTLAGLGVSSAIILSVSFFMAGIQGYTALIQLWLGYTSGLPATGPDIMMNWRMIGVNLSPYLGAGPVWAIVFAGMVATLLGTLFIWRYQIDVKSPSYVIALLGTFAATGALAWHSHISSAMILIAPLIYLSQQKEYLPPKILSLWVFVPPAFRFIVFILAILIQIQLMPTQLTGLLNLLIAISPLGLNIYFLGWAITHFRKSNISAN